MSEGIREIEVALKHGVERLEALGDAVALFMASPFMLALATQTHFIEVSGQWTVVLGWTRQELLSKPWIEFVHPEDREKTHGAALEMQAGPLFGDFTNRYQTRWGTWQVLRWVAEQWRGGFTYAVAMPVRSELGEG